MGIVSSRQSFHIIACGLDNSGKSTIVNQLKPRSQRVDHRTITATVGCSVESFSTDSLALTVFDVGGARKYRDLWEGFYSKVSGVIFVVDSTDAMRMNLAGEELAQVAKHPDLTGIPVLVFANKQDLPNARTPAELTGGLELDKILDGHTFNIFGSDARRGTGLSAGLDWLSKNMKPRHEANSSFKNKKE